MSTQTVVNPVQATKTRSNKYPFGIVIAIRDFVNILFQQKGTTFVQLFADVEPTMRKTGNRFLGAVVKKSEVNAVIGYQYEKMVQNRREKEFSQELNQSMMDAGVPAHVLDAFSRDLDSIVSNSVADFTAKPLQWGKHMIDPITGEVSRVLIDHTNKDGEYKIYAQMAILNTKTPVFVWKETGQELSENEVAEMKTFISEKPDNGGRQGLDNPYIIRTYCLSNVKEVTMNKTHYILNG
jgi:hypothetical protein